MSGLTHKLPLHVPSEKDIEDQILTWLSYQKDCFAFKVDTKSNFDPSRGIYRRLSKWVIPGTPDIICVLSFQGMPIFIGLECKTEKGRQSAYQKSFQSKIESQVNGFYFIVRSVQETQSALDQVKHQCAKQIALTWVQNHKK